MDVYYKETSCFIGMGAFAGRAFRKGERVLRPTGELIDHQTMYSIQVGYNLHLNVGAPAMYLNHSCEPNLGVKSDPDGWPVFYALRDLEKDEEITFDYAMTEYMHYPRANPEEDFDLTCYCGSPNCRGRLGYYSELSDELKKKYQGFISAYLLLPQPETVQK